MQQKHAKRDDTVAEPEIAISQFARSIGFMRCAAPRYSRIMKLINRQTVTNGRLPSGHDRIEFVHGLQATIWFALLAIQHGSNGVDHRGNPDCHLNLGPENSVTPPTWPDLNKSKSELYL